MNIIQKQIEESINIMIAEIEGMRTELLTNFCVEHRNRQAMLSYFHVKIGMCLSSIDIYRSQYALSLNILQWFKENYASYFKLRNSVYFEEQNDH